MQICDEKIWEIYRSPDPTFIHPHHEKNCKRTELGKKFESCYTVRYLHMASYKTLNAYLQSHMNILENLQTRASKEKHRKDNIRKTLLEERREKLKRLTSIKKANRQLMPNRRHVPR